MLTDLEKKVISLIQADIPVVERPYAQMAEKIGITEEKFLEVLKTISDKGLIRRFGATLKHQNSGFKANAMVAWKVDEKKIEQTGSIMASFHEITHCYRREPTLGWKYNLYTMVHAANEEKCKAIVKKISKIVNENDYIVLFSQQELKKTSMQYFKT